ncbi:MAG: transglutaminase family protein [Betaproteobacteria bacterium]
MVRLEFTIHLDYEVASPADFVFLIAAAKSPCQAVVSERLEVDRPTATSWFSEPHFGNRLLRLRATPGPLHVAYSASVDIRHTFADPASIGEASIADVPADVLPFLAASRYCQSDRLVQFAHDEFGPHAPGYARVDAIAKWVRDHVRFQGGTSNTSTSALDTLADRRGVCRDFAHLMIAACRAINIPARFVTGIDYDADPALGPCDFHAYVEAWLGNRWYLFDPTGISPTTGLVRIGTGRDAADVAFATIYGQVRTHAPAVSIVAIEDAGRGIRLPHRTSRAVSTAVSANPVGAHRAPADEATLLPFLLHAPRDAARRRAT